MPTGFESYAGRGFFGGNTRGSLSGILPEDTNEGLGFNYNSLFSALGANTQARAGELQRAAEGLFRSRAEGIRGGFEAESQQLGDRFAQQGVDPFFGQAAIEERRASVAPQIAGARGEADQFLGQSLAQLLGEDFESRASLSLAQRQARLNYYFQRLAYSASRKGQTLGTLGNIAGLGLTAGLLFAGGPAGAAAAPSIGAMRATASSQGGMPSVTG